MKLTRRARWTALAICVVAVLGCGGDTGGERFSFTAMAAGVPEAAAPFMNARGWTVSLSRAELALGPVYLNAVAPLRTASTAWWTGLVPSAFAGGNDHLAGGRVLGEVLDRVVFDARSGQMKPFATLGSATSEQVRTADIWFYPPAGTSAETTRSVPASLSLVGVAERGTERMPFRGELVLDDSWLAETLPGSRATRTVTSLRQVRGLAASFLPRPGGVLQIRVDVRALFRGADFASLDPQQRASDGVYVLSQVRGATDQVMTNLFQGLQATRDVYAIAWADSM